jgi:pimeloyl-ACP methyl ester carboxylesterase
MITTLLYSLLALLPAASFTYQYFSAQREKQACSPPPGELVDIGSNRLHILCQGQARPGVPTVILESGIWGCSLDWQLVQPEIARFTQVCSYDRAGYGWSERGPQPRTIQQLVIELKALLTKKGLQPPFIFVGHSLGGAVVRYYCAHYPDEVIGLVLVDAISEYAPPRFSRLFWGISNAIYWLAPFGALRLLNLAPAYSSHPAWTSERQKRYLACHQLKPRTLYTCFEEAQSLDESLQTLLREKKPLGNKSLIVIHRGSEKPIRPGLSQEENEKIYKDLRESQLKLAKESTQSELIIAEKSSHLINFDQPEIIASAVQKIVKLYADKVS